MHKILILWFTAILFFISSISPLKSVAWGPDGHTIVLQTAMHFLSPAAKQQVLSVLDKMPFDTAANWMDIMRSNSDYDFMKPWHYIDFDKSSQYQPSADENIVNRLMITYNELRHKNVLCSGQVKMDLLVLIHLMGDLSQPLHTGYDEDMGGNKRALQYDALKTNLHKFWDEEIIRLNKITLEDCLALYNTYQPGKADTITGIHPALWMKETRLLLEDVYTFDGFTADKNYLRKSGITVKRQLLIAGIRLADMFNIIFSAEAPVMDMKQAIARYKNGIDAKDAAKSKGKKVTACGHVYGIKSTGKVSFMNVGDRFPNSPLTVVIFEKDKAKFSLPVEELYAGKNICINGEIVEYNGKSEIIVTSAEDITIE